MNLNILEYEFYPNLKEYAISLFNKLISLNYHNIYKYMFQVIYLLKFGKLINHPIFSRLSKFDLYIIFFEDYKYRHEILKLCNENELNYFFLIISATKWNYNNIVINEQSDEESNELNDELSDELSDQLSDTLL